jgi:Uma2 family endonuclease
MRVRRQHRYTAADLEGMNVDRGARIEIIDGELHIYRPVADPQHQSTTQEIAHALFRWSRESKRGFSVMAPGVIFGLHDEVAPDTMWISRERFNGALNENGHLTVAPELMVEVLSPDEADERRVRELKLKLYAQQDVAEYWIADYQQCTVQIFRRDSNSLALVETLGDGDVLTSPLLPGFAITVDDLWQPLFGRRREVRASRSSEGA